MFHGSSRPIRGLITYGPCGLQTWWSVIAPDDCSTVQPYTLFMQQASALAAAELAN